MQVSKMVKSQGSTMAEDRRALLAEQNASMEQLVNIISATVNRDLPLRMEEIVRAEVSWILVCAPAQTKSQLLETILPAVYQVPMSTVPHTASTNSVVSSNKPSSVKMRCGTVADQTRISMHELALAHPKRSQQIS